VPTWHVVTAAVARPLPQEPRAALNPVLSPPCTDGDKVMSTDAGESPQAALRHRKSSAALAAPALEDLSEPLQRRFLQQPLVLQLSWAEMPGCPRKVVTGYPPCWWAATMICLSVAPKIQCLLCPLLLQCHLLDST